VAMTSATTAFVATSGDTVWRSVDAGASWTQVAGTTGARNRAIDASGSVIVVVGQSDAIAISRDGGQAFEQATGSTGMHLRGVDVVDEHVAFVVGADAVRMRTDADLTPAAQVADWTPGTADWTTGGFFGVCLQAIGGAAVAEWTLDTFNMSGVCQQLNSDPWRALPAVASNAARTTGPGTGTVDLVWGFRPRLDQQMGTYAAAVAFEVVAPAT
jgi:hypothetical protein